MSATSPTTSATPTRSSGAGLERSCAGAGDWIRAGEPAGGIERFEAWFSWRSGPAYRRHRHDTYAIGLTLSGVQRFWFRGATHVSLPGEVQVLHPDEPHDGYAGTEAGFGYRLLYVEPAEIFEAIRQMGVPSPALPFVCDPVVQSPELANAIRTAFVDGAEPLAHDDVVLRLAEGLLAADLAAARIAKPRRIDVPAIARARQFLDAETGRIVRSEELERVAGLTRFELARQFRIAFGTSPYRYSLMRRLAATRGTLATGRPPADIALDAGFADQAHFTRMFAAAYGMTPARYARLSAACL